MEKARLDHWIATLLELGMLYSFVMHEAWEGIALWAGYFYYSATLALMLRVRREL